MSIFAFVLLMIALLFGDWNHDALYCTALVFTHHRSDIYSVVSDGKAKKECDNVKNSDP